MDYLGFIVSGSFGAAIAGAGFVVGRLTRKKKDPYQQKKAICNGCDHHRSYHTDDDGCQYNISVYAKTVGSFTPCPCMSYSGPIPYDEFFAEET